MEEATFKLVVDQAVDSGHAPKIMACGHGESILHPEISNFVRYTRKQGLEFGLQTNGALLNKTKRAALLDAGISAINISVSFTDKLYEKTYRLKYQPILENIKALIADAKGVCDIGIYIVMTDLNEGKINEYKKYWFDIGVDRVDVFSCN